MSTSRPLFKQGDLVYSKNSRTTIRVIANVQYSNLGELIAIQIAGNADHNDIVYGQHENDIQDQPLSTFYQDWGFLAKSENLDINYES